MDTTRNRAAILAQFLRAATKDVRRPLVARDEVEAALASIDQVAEELEAIAADRTER